MEREFLSLLREVHAARELILTNYELLVEIDVCF
jgi:hypothetical protein